MTGIKELVKQRFPHCVVAVDDYDGFVNILSVKYEEGGKDLPDGKPKWFWHEWCFFVNKDETTVDGRSLGRTLDDLEIQVRGTIEDYRK